MIFYDKILLILKSEYIILHLFWLLTLYLGPYLNFLSEFYFCGKFNLLSELDILRMRGLFFFVFFIFRGIGIWGIVGNLFCGIRGMFGNLFLNFIDYFLVIIMRFGSFFLDYRCLQRLFFDYRKFNFLVDWYDFLLSFLNLVVKI